MIVGSSGSSSVVEHLLAKEGVASSNLVFRSTPTLCGGRFCLPRRRRRRDWTPSLWPGIMNGGDGCEWLLSRREERAPAATPESEGDEEAT